MLFVTRLARDIEFLKIWLNKRNDHFAAKIQKNKVFPNLGTLIPKNFKSVSNKSASSNIWSDGINVLLWHDEGHE